MRLPVLVAALLWLVPALPAQEPPKDLAQWELICFCSGNPTPHAIIRDDNNGQILYAARHGTTRARLKAEDIPFTESQIRLLEDWRLLTESNGELQVAIPILGPDEMTRLRSLVHGPAVALGQSLQPDLLALVWLLAQQGNARSAYTIVFSYLLDGQVWVRFYDAKLLPSDTITADKPFWSGAFWALYPRRDGPGTNTMENGGWSSSVLWTQPVLPLLGPVSSTSVMGAALAQLKTQGKVTDPAARPQLEALGVLDHDGRPAVPVIHQQASDPVYAASLAISRKVSAAVLQMLQNPDIPALIGAAQPGEVLEITYHEFMWELLAYLQEARVLMPPPILTAQHPDPQQVRDLVFLVVQQP